MKYNDRFISLLRAVIFYSVVWVLMSFVLFMVTLLVSLPCLLGNKFTNTFLSLYCFVELGFAIAYIFVIIDSVTHFKHHITEKKGEDSQ